MNLPIFRIKKNLLVAEYLYEKHGIDSAQLASSQSYYAKNPKKYVPIFKKIQLELDRLNDSIPVNQCASNGGVAFYKLFRSLSRKST